MVFPVRSSVHCTCILALYASAFARLFVFQSHWSYIIELALLDQPRKGLDHFLDRNIWIYSCAFKEVELFEACEVFLMLSALLRRFSGLVHLNQADR